MKTWKKVLLEAGIFTSVFALGACTGFLTNYHTSKETVPATKIIAIENDDTPREETPTEKFLSCLVNAKALEGNVNLNLSMAEPQNDAGTPEGRAERALNDFDLGNIELNITNLEVSIADIENIKVAADLNVKMKTLDLNLSLGYFDNTIYLDYADTHFFLKTDDITDVMDMLPTFGVELELPEEFSNLDFDALTESLTKMEEYKENNEHYFLFNFSDDIAIKMLSDDEYNMIGVELPEISLMGMNISATSDIHPLPEDIETLINPSLKENAPEYTEFKPAFTLINDVMNLVNEKAARVEIDVDLNKLDSNEQYAEFLDLDGTLDFDINELAVAADLTVKYADKPYNVKAAYKDETIYASFKNLNLSIEQQSVLSLVDYLSTKIKNDKLDEIMDKLGSISDEIDLDTILTYVNDLPTYIHDFKLTNDSLSLTIDPSYFSIPVSAFDLAVTFDDSSVTGLSLKGLAYKGIEVNAELKVKSYVPVELNPDDYLAVDPALSLISSIEKLIKQDKFGISFSINTDDNNSETYDLNADGVFHFALRDKTDSEFENHMIKTKRTFDYGAGELTIRDGDQYPHNIKVDAEAYNENMDGKVLFSYGGTTNKRTNAKIDYATFDALVDRIIALFESEDPHVMELFGSLIEQTEASPLGVILSSNSTADYLKLLDYDIITSLNITDSEVTVGVNGALLGFDDMNPVIKIRYTEDSLSGLDITGIVLGGKTINASVDVLDFNQETYEYYDQVEDDSYIDLSTISKLVEEALNTADKSYYHMNGTIDFDLDSSFLNALGSLMGNKTMKTDLQVNTWQGRTTVLAHLSDVPVIPVVSVNYSTGLLGECSKDSYLMFDNLDNSAAGIGKTGIFHIYRYDKWFNWGNKTEEIKSKYETPYLLDNIITVLMSDLLGFGDKILNAVSNIEGGDGQIHYEQIIQDYSYEAGYPLTNSNYNSGNKVSVDKYHFAIDVGELAQNDDLKTLAVTVYARDGQLCGIEIDMSLNPGVGMTLNLKMFLNETDYTSHDDMASGRITSMNAYVAAHENDPINSRA